jgi:hypothetical protein
MNAFPSPSASAYVDRWFWRFDALVDALGAPANIVSMLIEAGCAPGPIYARAAGEQWWSALAASRGFAPARPSSDARRWYSPSSAWDLRRAILNMRAGLTLVEAALANRTHFVAGFVRALPHIDGAQDAYPSCWTEKGFDGEAAALVAEREWDAWLDGAYGVCLRVFNADTCIRKESLVIRIKQRLPAAHPIDLLDDARALAQMILPFAPWERPHCTPGATIDPLLERASLGRELPYPI